MGVCDSRELSEALKNVEASTSATPQPDAKIVWLIRHTRSEQNSGERLFAEGEAIAGTCKMLTGFNARPSARGEEMLQDRASLGTALAPRLDGVFYSPLLRAKATKDALFGPDGPRHWPLSFLKEKTRREHLKTLPAWRLSSRVKTFDEHFLRTVPLKEFALVGHSVFFRSMIFGSEKSGEAGFVMGNVDVWGVEVAPWPQPLRLRVVCTTCEHLDVAGMDAESIIDVIHLGQLVLANAVDVRCDYYRGDVAAWRSRLTNGFDSLDEPVVAHLVRCLASEGTTRHGAEEALRALGQGAKVAATAGGHDFSAGLGALAQ